MSIKNRIQEIRKMKARDLVAHPLNWRIHTDSQEAAMRDILQTLGAADVIKAYVNEKGEVVVLDGHLRKEIDPDYEWNVAIMDFTEGEARQFLATYDPITEMAAQNQGKLEELLKGTMSSSPGMALILKELGDRFNVPFFIDGVGQSELGVGRPDVMATLTSTNRRYVMLSVADIGCLIPIDLYNRVAELCNSPLYENNSDCIVTLLEAGLSKLEDA